MIRKLQAEIKKVQGLATTVHSTDVSRLSTTMAAVNMGISTMRRRPLRTLLTAVTVVLLTFTILTFASFGSKWDVGKTYQGPMMSKPARILVRQHMAEVYINDQWIFTTSMPGPASEGAFGCWSEGDEISLEGLTISSLEPLDL